MLFLDDIVFVIGRKGNVSTEVELWREILEFKNCKFSSSEIKYIEYKFSKNRSVDVLLTRFED